MNLKLILTLISIALAWQSVPRLSTDIATKIAKANAGSVEYKFTQLNPPSIKIGPVGENGWAAVEWQHGMPPPLLIDFDVPPSTDSNAESGRRGHYVYNFDGVLKVQIVSGNTNVIGVIYNDSQLTAEGYDAELMERNRLYVRGAQYAQTTSLFDEKAAWQWLGYQNIPNPLGKMIDNLQNHAAKPNGENGSGHLSYQSLYLESMRVGYSDYRSLCSTKYQVEKQGYKFAMPPIPLYKKPAEVWTPIPGSQHGKVGYYFFAKSLESSTKKMLESGEEDLVILNPAVAELIGLNNSTICITPVCFRGHKKNPGGHFEEWPMEYMCQCGTFEQGRMPDKPTWVWDTERKTRFKVYDSIFYQKNGETWTGLFIYSSAVVAHRDAMFIKETDKWIYCPDLEDEQYHILVRPVIPKLPEACDIRGGTAVEVFAIEAEPMCWPKRGKGQYDPDGFSIFHKKEEVTFYPYRVAAVFSCNSLK